jgi:hypothetical protein
VVVNLNLKKVIVPVYHVLTRVKMNATVRTPYDGVLERRFYRLDRIGPENCRQSERKRSEGMKFGFDDVMLKPYEVFE